MYPHESSTASYSVAVETGTVEARSDPRAPWRSDSALGTGKQRRIAWPHGTRDSQRPCSSESGNCRQSGGAVASPSMARQPARERFGQSVTPGAHTWRTSWDWACQSEEQDQVSTELSSNYVSQCRDNPVTDGDYNRRCSRRENEIIEAAATPCSSPPYRGEPTKTPRSQSQVNIEDDQGPHSCFACRQCNTKLCHHAGQQIARALFTQIDLSTVD